MDGTLWEWLTGLLLNMAGPIERTDLPKKDGDFQFAKITKTNSIAPMVII